jgi:tetratricopeptide (TPR) repeat protein
MGDVPAQPDDLLAPAHDALAAGDYACARELFSAAVARGEDAREDVTLLAAHNGLGLVGKYTGDFAGAARHYERAGQLLRRRDPRPSRDHAALEHNLGGLAHSRGDLSAAEQHTRAALALRERLGSLAVELASEQLQLATIVSESGRHDEARELLEAALASFRGAYGAEHIEVAIALTTLAAVEHRAGCRERAEELYREGLALRESLLGADHPELSATLINLARLREQQGDASASRSLLERALGVLEPAVAPDHPRLVAARSRLAALGDGG